MVAATSGGADFTSATEAALKSADAGMRRPMRVSRQVFGRVFRRPITGLVPGCRWNGLLVVTFVGLFDGQLGLDRIIPHARSPMQSESSSIPLSGLFRPGQIYPVPRKVLDNQQRASPVGDETADQTAVGPACLTGIPMRGQ